MVRRGFTLIELVFAIVIIAISVMSLPMMMQVNATAIQKNLVQEAIFASVSEINTATTYVWDDNSLDDGDIDNSYSRVLHTGGTNDCNSTSNKRIGHIHRQCLDTATLTLHTTAYPTTDERHHIAVDGSLNTHIFRPIFISTSNNGDVGLAKASATGYKQLYNSQLVVNLSSAGGKQFGSESNNQNIKEIVVEVADDDNNTVTLLRTYVANIGELEYHSQLLP